MMASEDHHKVRRLINEFMIDSSQWASGLAGTGAVYQLEKKFVSLVGHPHALAVANATLGLLAVFVSLGLHDSEIVVSPYTWGGSLAGLLSTGNRPVFADIDQDSLTLDPNATAEAITSKTKAILAPDIYGYPSDGPALRKIADAHGLVLIQDCAQSFGAYIAEHHTGWWADAAVFSLGPTKALYAGEGGMIVTPNRDLFDRLVWTTQHPLRQRRDTPNRPLNEFALNLRINPMAAAWAAAMFDDALEFVAEKSRASIKILHVLRENALSKTKHPDPQKLKPSFHRLTFEPASGLAEGSNGGLDSRIWPAPITEPVYRHDSYRELIGLKALQELKVCPVAERQCRYRLCVPFETVRDWMHERFRNRSSPNEMDGTLDFCIG